MRQVLKFFSYEHFYVIYCKFWELDTDHDFLIDKDDLLRYGNHALTYRIVDRVFAQARLLLLPHALIQPLPAHATACRRRPLQRAACAGRGVWAGRGVGAPTGATGNRPAGCQPPANACCGGAARGRLGGPSQVARRARWATRTLFGLCWCSAAPPAVSAAWRSAMLSTTCPRESPAAQRSQAPAVPQGDARRR